MYRCLRIIKSFLVRKAKVHSIYLFQSVLQCLTLVWLYNPCLQSPTKQSVCGAFFVVISLFHHLCLLWCYPDIFHCSILIHFKFVLFILKNIATTITITSSKTGSHVAAIIIIYKTESYVGHAGLKLDTC